MAQTVNKRARFRMDSAPAVDLTPMIDIVFNLIIFFMIVSELSNLDVEQLRLPFADEAEPAAAAAQEDRVLQVNVLASGVAKVRGRSYDTRPEDGRSPRLAWLGDLMQAEAAGTPLDPDGASTLRVNVRADRDARFEHVQRVLDTCQRNDVYRTSLAATQDAPAR